MSVQSSAVLFALSAVIVAGMCALSAQADGKTGAVLQIAQNDQPAADAPKGDGKDTVALREFMRQKLIASNQILEGLVTEDAEMIRVAADRLNKLSQAEQWRVRNDVMYRQFSGEFQRITEQLSVAAKKGNMDQAALKWMDATMSCIECHRFVRGVMVTKE
ncbi:MAG: hypothetical protein KDA90_06005 [Planctomycetaceae bacterium]|nr:hypothetical protein [Planctomycetaceae bacterium]